MSLTKKQNKNVKKLIKALRSGNYKQGRSALRNNDGTYCCLGVACSISKLGKWEPMSEAIVALYGISQYVVDADRHCPAWDNLSNLPSVRDYFGWNGQEFNGPELFLDKAARAGGSRVRSLTDLNDGGATFEEIADALEEWRKENK